jgi:hypothetical protein
MSNYKIFLFLLTNVNNIQKNLSTFLLIKARYFGNEGKNSMNKDESKPILVEGLELFTLGWGKKL